MLLRAERTLPVSLKQALELIHDTEAYPSFLPGIVAVSNISSSEDGATRTSDLTLRLGFRQISGAVRARMETAVADNVVSFTLLQGPFKQARGSLRLAPMNGGVKVAAECEYETPLTRFDELIQNKLNPLIDAVVVSFLAQAKRRFG